MIARETQILPVMPAADHTGLEGHFVDIDNNGLAAVSTDETVEPFGVITEGFPAGHQDSIATPGYGGTVKVKLAETPGTVVLGTRLQLSTAGDGTVAADNQDGVIVAQALEPGAAGELIEARLVEPLPLAS